MNVFSNSESEYFEKDYDNNYRGEIVRFVDSCFNFDTRTYLSTMIVSIGKELYYPIIDSRENNCVGLINVDKDDRIKNIFIYDDKRKFVFESNSEFATNRYKGYKVIFLFRKDDDR